MTESERTLRGLRWAAWAVALVALAWGLLAGVRPVVAYGLAQLGVLLALKRYPALALQGVEVQRTMPAAAVEDGRVRVRFEVAHRGRLPLYAPVVVDRFTPDRTPRREAPLYPWLLPGQGRAVGYVGRCFSKRGRHLVGPAALTTRGPLGLYRAERSLADACALIVYPTVEPLPTQPAPGASASPLFGGLSTRDQGAGDLPLSVRDYRPGDPPRRIHWPTSARRGRLAILERERHVVQRLTIYLDTSQGALRGLGRHSTLEVSVRAAAAVAAHALDEGYRLGLRGCGQHDLPLGGGRAQLARILDSLALVKPRANAEPLSQLVRADAHALSAGQGAFLIVAEAERDLEPLLTTITALQAQGCWVTVALLDPFGFPRLHQQAGPPPSLDAVAARLVTTGARVYGVRPDDALAVALAEPYRGRARLRITREAL